MRIILNSILLSIIFLTLASVFGAKTLLAAVHCLEGDESQPHVLLLYKENESYSREKILFMRTKFDRRECKIIS